jgi:hypothetical protein
MDIQHRVVCHNQCKHKKLFEKPLHHFVPAPLLLKLPALALHTTSSNKNKQSLFKHIGRMTAKSRETIVFPTGLRLRQQPAIYRLSTGQKRQESQTQTAQLSVDDAKIAQHHTHAQINPYARGDFPIAMPPG